MKHICIPVLILLSMLLLCSCANKKLPTEPKEIGMELELAEFEPLSSQTKELSLTGFAIPHEDIPVPENEDELWEASHKTEPYFHFKRNINGVDELIDNTIFLMFGDTELGRFHDEELDVRNAMQLNEGYLIEASYPREYYTGEDYVEPSVVYPVLVRLDGSFNELWRATWDDGLSIESIRGIIEEEDGSLLVISKGEKLGVDGSIIEDAVCSCRIDQNGAVTILSRNADCSDVFYGMTPFDDGYIGVTFNYDETAKYGLVKLNANGEVEKTIKYCMNDKSLSVRDVLEYNGKLWVACDLTKNDLSYPDSAAFSDASIITSFAKEAYSAMLLVCDRESMTPESFYLIEAAKSAELKLDGNGRLAWEFGLIYGADTVSGTIMPKCSGHRYVFDNKGMPISFEELGRLDYYR